MKIFVYGTLKKGFSNHRLLDGATFIGCARTVEPHVLLDSGFPVCVPISTGASYVTGEVYEFDSRAMLNRLDGLESEGHMYHRVKKWVRFADGKSERVWIYIGDSKRWSHTRIGAHWIDGDKFVYARRVAQWDNHKEEAYDHE